MRLKIATNIKSSLLQKYCDEYNHDIYYDDINLINESYKYHIIVSNLDSDKYGFCHKNIKSSILDLLSTKEIDCYFRKKRPQLFTTIAYDSDIPKSIHFVWLTKDIKSNKIDELPKQYNKNIESFKKYCPDYDIKIWYIDEVDNMIKNNLPEFYDTYQNITPWISKCDFVRFCIIYLYGGVYSDCDFYCMKSLNGLLKHKNEIYIAGDSGHLFNGFFASTPKSKFIYDWLLTMQNNKQYPHVMDKTGPWGFTRYYSKSIKPKLSDRRDILPFDYDYPEKCDNVDYYVYTLWDEGCGWQFGEDYTGFIICIIICILIILYALYNY
jgi:mannosyltransferase OCH1-like enzyme